MHLAFFEDRAELLDRVDTTRVKVHRLSRRRKLDLDLVASIARVIDENAIDLVHCTLQISLFFTVLALRRTRARPALVTAVHTTVNRGWREEAFDRLLYRRLLRRCDRVVFVCRAQADYWVRKYPELRDIATVVYNGVETTGYHEAASASIRAHARGRYGLPAEAKVIACIAGLRAEKGHEHLLRAFARLQGSPTLLLAGDGPERTRIERLTAELNLHGRVALLGEVADVQSVIAASDLTVLASTAVETFSMAMLESMAMAVPVVASDIGGLSEAIIPGETGYLVPPGDTNALAAALASALQDDAGRSAIGARALQMVRNRFSLPAMADATASMLTQVLGGSTSSPLSGPLLDRR
jgi:glycosyltransferase involved in cell wall biosynthesis